MVLLASKGLTRKKNPNPILKSNPTTSIIHALRPHAAIKSVVIVRRTEVEKIAEIKMAIAGALRKIRTDEVATEIVPLRDGPAAANDERAELDLPNAPEVREETERIAIGETEIIHDANGTETETENDVPTTRLISEAWTDALRTIAIVITTTTIGVPG